MMVVGDVDAIQTLAAQPAEQGQSTQEVDCPEERTGAAVTRGEWEIWEESEPDPTRPRLRDAVDFLLVCVGRAFRREPAATATETPTPTPTPTATRTPSRTPVPTP